MAKTAYPVALDVNDIVELRRTIALDLAELGDWALSML